MFNKERDMRLRAIEWNLVELRKDIEQLNRQLEKVVEAAFNYERIAIQGKYPKK